MGARGEDQGDCSRGALWGEGNMGCLMIVPLVAAITGVALYMGSLVGLFLASFTAMATSLAGLLALVLLI